VNIYYDIKIMLISALASD